MTERGNATMRAARAHAIDVLLRQAIGNDPWPATGGVVLIDEPAKERLQIRYQADHKVYVLFTNRLAFARRADGSLDLCPCPPRPGRPKPPEGVVVVVPGGPRQTASWFFDAEVRLVDTGRL